MIGLEPVFFKNCTGFRGAPEIPIVGLEDQIKLIRAFIYIKPAEVMDQVQVDDVLVNTDGTEENNHRAIIIKKGDR